MSVLIFTSRNDTHSRVVEACLSGKGIAVTRFFGNEFPKRSLSTIELGSEGLKSVSLTEDGKDGRIELSGYDCIWFRRPGRPSLREGLHLDDHDISERENLQYYRNLVALLAEQSFWVNDPQKKHLADNKLLQLLYAQEIGLTIPTTLASNNAEEIKYFSTQHGTSELMFKSFTPVSWHGGKEMLYCTRVSCAAIPERNVANAAGIWQVPISKKFEVRATFFGKTCFAVQIDSQETRDGRDDWRRARGAYAIRPFVLDSQVQSHCIELMKRLGIVFGCFDFIVTPVGRYVFLEVNESGQFLWVEERCPEVPLLDAFVTFLLQRTKEFVYVEKPDRLRLAEIYASDSYKQLEAVDRHFFYSCLTSDTNKDIYERANETLR